MKRKSILVFGASGFVGTYLIERLLEVGHDVTASDISDDGRAYYANRVPYLEVDITQKEDFERLAGKRYDVVVHLAACQPANVSAQDYDPTHYINVNVIGTLNILEFCRGAGVGRIVYASSHRNTQGLWAANRAIREEDGRSLKYDGEYAMFSISESAAQDCVQHYYTQYGLTGVIFRLPPVYGFGPHTEIFKGGKAIKTGFQIFIEKARACEPLEIWGDCDVGRDIIYIKDVVAAFEKAIDKPSVASGLYNITSGEYLTLRRQAEMIAETFWGSHGAPELVFKPDEYNGMDAFLYDNSKAKRELDWQPQYKFQAMLLDYKEEAESGRFDYLVKKRLRMLK